MHDNPNRLLSHYELARILEVSPRHVQYLADNDIIPEVRISKQVRRYYLPAVLEALENQGKQAVAHA